MSTTINTGGPAFPIQDSQTLHAWASSKITGITDPTERDRVYVEARAEAIRGMTMRDHFAGLAMEGELAAMSDESGASGVDLNASEITLDRLAKHWYRIADAMIRARGH